MTVTSAAVITREQPAAEHRSPPAAASNATINAQNRCNFIRLVCVIRLQRHVIKELDPISNYLLKST